jgi:dolichol-phosphate mannosyltransferase
MVVGGLGVGVNSAALVLLHQWAGLPLLVASPLAVELSIVNNFIWNDRWTFASRNLDRMLLERFARFNVVSALSLVITASVTILLVQELAMPYLVSSLCGISLAGLCNIVANVRWTWRPA